LWIQFCKNNLDRVGLYLETIESIQGTIFGNTERARRLSLRNTREYARAIFGNSENLGPTFGNAEDVGGYIWKFRGLWGYIWKCRGRRSSSPMSSPAPPP
jgi:hypothetical protein